MYTRVKDVFQHSLSNFKQELCRALTITYVPATNNQTLPILIQLNSLSTAIVALLRLGMQENKIILITLFHFSCRSGEKKSRIKRRCRPIGTQENPSADRHPTELSNE